MRNGLNNTINKPAIKFDIASFAAKPIIAAKIPAPEKIYPTCSLKTGTENKIIITPIRQKIKRSELRVNFNLVSPKVSFVNLRFKKNIKSILKKP